MSQSFYKLPSEEKQIGSFRFTLTKLMATEARETQVLIARVLGPALGILGNKELTEGAIAQAMQAASQALTNEDLDKVVRVLAKSSRVHLPDGKTPLLTDVYELFFANEGMLLHWKWIGAALAYNFADFLGELAGGNLAELLKVKSE